MNTHSRQKLQKPPETPPSRNRAPRNTSRYAARKAYNRIEQLPRRIGLWPHEVEDCSEAASVRIVALLRKALRCERQRGIGGHWTYDVNRHMALHEALVEENERLRILKGLAEVGAFPSRSAKKEPSTQGEKRPRAEILHLPFGKAAAANTKPR
jgi:hypothetical protein